MKGVYGGGVLGDAKIVAENELLKFRVEQPAEQFGSHVVVRYPAFLSAALFGIPGGGLCGLVERKILEERGLYSDMEELAQRTLLELFGTHWVRRNLLAQIQLDAAESTFVDACVDKLTELDAKVRGYLSSHPGEQPPLSAAASWELLKGYVPDNYRDLLAAYRAADVGDATVKA
jgi:hypothetical protein